MAYILSYDLGTGGLKTSLFDEKGQSVGFVFQSIQTYFRENVYHEQKPADWWQALVDSTKAVLQQTQVCKDDILALAISGHSLGVVPVNQQGQLLTEYTPIWSDRRGETQAKAFFLKTDENAWYLRTGNGFPAGHYGIFKIMHLKETQRAIYDQTACFLGTKDFLNYKLTGVMATDHSYASGSGVYDLKKNTYIQEYLDILQVDVQKMPAILESTTQIGTLTQEVADLLSLNKQTKVAAGGVDNACMALGAMCTQNGDTYTSLGTSAWVAVTSDTPIVEVHTHPYVFAHVIPHMYTSATSIFSAGNSFRWMKNTLFSHLEEQAKSEQKDVYDILTDMAQKAPVMSHNVFFCPNLAGGSGLDKSVHIKGCYTGLTLSTSANDIVRATLEGICFGLRNAQDVLSDYVPLQDEMLLVGGGAKSAFWVSLFADIYKKKIVTTNVGQDAGALGAAVIAGVMCKMFSSFNVVKDMHTQKHMQMPDLENCKKYDKGLQVFHKICDMQSDMGDLLETI